jgi:hypothetical protein
MQELTDVSSAVINRVAERVTDGANYSKDQAVKLFKRIRQRVSDGDLALTGIKSGFV